MKSKRTIKSIIVMTFIMIASVMFLNMSLAANTAKIMVETANLRKETSSDSQILAQMSENEDVEIVENSGDWSKVKYKNITGYVKTNLLSVNNNSTGNTTENVTNNTTTNTEENTNQNNISQNDTNITTDNKSNETTSTNQNEQATTNNKENSDSNLGEYIVVENTKLKLVPLIYATDMVEVQKDSKLEVLKIANGWAYIEQNSIRGWIRTEKIKTEAQLKAEQEEATKKAEQEAQAVKEAENNAEAIRKAYVKSESVNLRKESNSESELVGNLPQNTEVEVLVEDSNGWTKCRVNGLIGYISTQYLSNSKVETQSTTARSSTEARIGTSSPVETTTSNTQATDTDVVSYAEQFLGKSYVYGATGPNAFDCSGFTQYVFAHFGITLSRTSEEQYSNGTAVSNLQPGDLVLFRSSSSSVGHVGIYIGGSRFIHAANASRGVTTDTLASGYYADNYVGARRVL